MAEAPSLVPCLAQVAVEVLRTADATRKADASRLAAAAWASGSIETIGRAEPPDRPARPTRPVLLPPRDMPKRRRAGSKAGRVALIHALAHIELNAIDLAWDIIARFCGEPLPKAFFDEWVKVADDEARHFAALSARLEDMGAQYGDLPAHDGLWQASEATANDLAARLAVVPMVLEARGLDVTPGMIVSLRAAADETTASILDMIYRDEVAHVASGCRWFRYLCAERGWEPVARWQELVRRYFKGDLKPPFNLEGRRLAGFGPEFYAPLAISRESTSERST